MTPPTRTPSHTTHIGSRLLTCVRPSMAKACGNRPNLSRLAIEILYAQRQTPLEMSQFAEGDVAQLVELVDRNVRGPSDRTCLIRHSTIDKTHNMRPSRGNSRALLSGKLYGTFQQLSSPCPIGEGLGDRRRDAICDACMRGPAERDPEGRTRPLNS